MIWLRLAIANLTLSPLTSAVNVMLMTLGAASIVLLLLAGSQLSETMARDARGVDLVLGATGSPVQLVLSAVYHADVPPGNIRLKEAERWAEDRRVQTAIPLSLGDSYQGVRIVGTTTAYAGLYGAELASGRFWNGSLEAVVGSAAAKSAGLQLGSQFAGAHGLAAGGHRHGSHPYRVVGVLEPTGTVIDRLILTSLESVWDVHAQGPSFARNHAVGDDRVSGPNQAEPDREITAMLIQYANPVAAISMPREINGAGDLQAASPAVEVTRVLQLIGIGLDGLRAFAWVLIATAALSVFAALYGSLRARRNDLAILRCLGATRQELLIALLLEGLLLSIIGVALGFIAGHTAMELLGARLESARGVALTGWTWIPEETVLLFSLFGVGAVAAVIPAVQAYRTDVARTLAEA